MASGGGAESAPVQLAMGGRDLWWKGTKWDFPRGTPKYWADGIPWGTFEDGKPPPGEAPLAYEPPQWRPGYLFGGIPCCLAANWWQARSPLCARAPCCCAYCIFKCGVPNSEYVSVADPDAWMVKMLRAGANPKCPELMRGIFWMCDNNAPHEVLLCFHDADWATEKVALKTYYHNYATAPTCFGAVTQFGSALSGSTLRVELSPNNKWVSIAGSSTPGWIYVDQPEDKHKCRGKWAPKLYGESFKPGGGEMLRVSHANEEEPLSEANYQYRLRRIAYLTDEGELVKTDAYEDLKRRGTMPFYPGHEPSCCGYCWCKSREDLALGFFPQLSDTLVVRYAPATPAE